MLAGEYPDSSESSSINLWVIQIERRQDEPLTRRPDSPQRSKPPRGRSACRRSRGLTHEYSGEHRSIRRGTGYEFLDLRPYSSGDEARSDRESQRPRWHELMIADKEQFNVTSRVWILLTQGRRCWAPAKWRDSAGSGFELFAMFPPPSPCGGAIAFRGPR